MKIIFAVVAVVIVGYAACRWFAPVPKQPTPAQTHRTATTPKPAAARPIPAKQPAAERLGARPTPARPVAQERHLAPEGTFFLLQRASLPIDSGVIGFAPGTKVTMVEQGDSASTVTDGQYQFTVQSSQLTNDLDLAASGHSAFGQGNGRFRDGRTKQLSASYAREPDPRWRYGANIRRRTAQSWADSGCPGANVEQF